MTSQFQCVITCFLWGCDFLGQLAEPTMLRMKSSCFYVRKTWLKAFLQCLPFPPPLFFFTFNCSLSSIISRKWLTNIFPLIQYQIFFFPSKHSKLNLFISDYLVGSSMPCIKYFLNMCSLNSVILSLYTLINRLKFIRFVKVTNLTWI